MIKFETLNELTLKATCDGQGSIYSKAGAYIGGESYGGKNYKFTKKILGPGNNIVAAAVGQVMRRVTSENFPIMEVTSQGANVTYYANLSQHVTVINLQPGQTLSIESENILAFHGCKYGVRFLGVGVISQKGLATSTLTGQEPNAQVAILTDGNPLLLSNQQSGACLTADPDAAVCWMGADPGIKFDLSWKNLIGQASGETYFFQWDKPATVVVQPSERKSGLDISMDGKRTGGSADVQQNQSLFGSGNSAAGSVGDATQGIGNMLGGLGNFLNR